MPIDVWEDVESPMLTYADDAGSGRPTGKAVFYARGSEDRTAVKSAIDGLLLNSIAVGSQVLTLSTVQLDWEAPEFFKATANYEPEEQEGAAQAPSPGAWSIEFDTTGESHKITQSITEIARGELSASRPAPESLGCIGWDGKKVQGTEIIVPKLELTINAYFAWSAVTTGFVANLARNTGKTNTAAWHDFDEGELLFKGASGVKDLPLAYGDRTKPVQIKLKFAASENRSSITITPGMVTSAKKGWELLTVRYREETVAGNGITRSVPEHWYIHKVYEDVAFDTLFRF